MKQKLLRLLLLPAIFCTLFAVGSFATAGAAHAATLRSHAAQAQAPAISRVTCDFVGLQAVFYTDYNELGHSWDPDCFSNAGWEYVNLYNVYELYTGNYTVNWIWIDCNGHQHASTKGPGTDVTPYNASGSEEYAGYDVMCDITYIALLQ